MNTPSDSIALRPSKCVSNYCRKISYYKNTHTHIYCIALFSGMENVCMFEKDILKSERGRDDVECVFVCGFYENKWFLSLSIIVIMMTVSSSSSSSVTMYQFVSPSTNTPITYSTLQFTNKRNTINLFRFSSSHVWIVVSFVSVFFFMLCSVSTIALICLDSFIWVYCVYC